MKHLLLTILILSFTTLYAGSSIPLEKVSLQLHWKYQFEFAGFIAAKEKGFYKDVGLDVELKEYVSGIDIEKDVIEGKSEYGIYNSLSLLDYLRGEPLVLVSSYFKRAALVLVTTPDILTPKDLVGKKIMASTKEDFILNYQPYFDGYGISVDEVQLVPHSYSIDEFASGKISAMTAFVSNELYKLDERGIKYNVLDPSDDNLYVLQLELITSKNEAQNHTSRVSRFKRASLRGWEYALSHKEELVDIIHNKYTDKTSRKMMMNEAIAVEKLILPFTYNLGSIDSNFLDKQIRLFKDYYKVGQDKSIDDFIFSQKGSSKLILTQEEQQYIKENPLIPLCLQYNQFPVDGYENGKFVGIMSDIYDLISKSTSLEFNPIESKSVEELKNNIINKECDLLSVYATKNKIYKNLNPTKPFSTTHFAIVSELDKSFTSSPDLLRDKVLLTQLESYKQYLKHLYPYLVIKVVEDKNKMISMLLNKEAYAVVTLDEQVDYIIDKYGYGKLKINGFLAKEKPIEVSIGVQKENRILQNIIQKALDDIPKSELIDISNSWRMTRYQSIVDYSLVMLIVALMSVIFLIMLYYHRKLKNFNRELERSVNEKTKALREINKYLEITVSQKVNELIKKDEILTTQSKQAVMGEMISMVAHQWRQPLNMITLNISNLQIKQMMGQKIEGEVLNATLDNISETIVYLSETVDDFKTYFHPDKESAVVEIDELLNRAINFILPRVKAAGVKLGVTQPSSIELRVYPNELIQVLLNILNNAVDAYENIIENDKAIEVYAKEIDTELQIYIKDNAGGIKEEYLQRLFEPYFSTKGKNGTGLGLYMSQMIIEKQFSGKIEVIVEGDSTLFIIKIPIANRD